MAWALPAGDACAGDSVTVAISTTVLPVCRFSASFPVGDVTDGASGVGAGEGGSVPARSAMTYRCTNGTAPAFAITAAAAGCAACSGTSNMAFMISPESSGAGRGFGDGRDLTLIVTAPIAPLQVASSGMVSVTVSP